MLSYSSALESPVVSKPRKALLVGDPLKGLFTSIPDTLPDKPLLMTMELVRCVLNSVVSPVTTTSSKCDSICFNATSIFERPVTCIDLAV